MNSCEEYQELISLAIDGEISEFDLARLRAHLAQCEECRLVYDAFLAVSAESDYLAEPPESLVFDVMDNINSEAAPKRGKKRRAWAAVAAIAACLVLVGVSVSGVNRSGDAAVEEASAADYSAALQDMDEAADESDFAFEIPAAESAPESAETEDSAEDFAFDSEDGAGSDASDSTESAMADEDMGIAVLMDMAEAEIFSGEAEDGGAEATITDSDTLTALADILSFTPLEDGTEPEGEPLFTIRMTGSDGTENDLCLWLYEGHLLAKLADSPAVYTTCGTLSDLVEFIRTA